ncbi:MAG: FtsX-like permease family protein [Gemmatimonadales bacterium]
MPDPQPSGWREILALFRWPTPLERRIARRYLQSRRSTRGASLTTIIAAGGVAVGVMALIVVLGVMNGLADDLRARILVASPHLRVLTYGSGLRLDDWPRILAEVRSEPGVVAAEPEVITESVISAGHDYAEGVQVFGIEPDTGQVEVTSLPEAVTRGDLRFRPTVSGLDGGVALGYRLADRLGVVIGDTVSLIPAGGLKVNPALGVAIPRYWRFQVTGLFDTGMYQYDNKLVLIDRKTAQQFTGLGEAVSGIAVRASDPWQAPALGRRLEEKLGGYPYRAFDWQTQNATLFGALKLEKLAMGLIIFFIMIVAAFNIVGTLTMVVTDKTREIGILKAMGLNARSIARIFVAQGAIIGSLGVAIGLVLGLAVAWGVDRWNWIRIDPGVYFIDHLPVHIEVRDVAVVVLASLLLAVLATVYPSRSAASLEPVEAIRHE